MRSLSDAPLRASFVYLLAGLILALPQIALASPQVSFQAPLNYPTATGYGDELTAGDVDADGNADIVSATYTTITILYGRGDGSFDTPLTLPVGSHVTETAIADFNGDGIKDLASTIFGGRNVVIYYGEGGRTFEPARLYTAGSQPKGISAGDVNEDGRMDFLVTNNQDHNVSVFLNDGNKLFTRAFTYPAGGMYAERVRLADFNRDGHLDFVVSNHMQGDVNIYLGRGDGQFTPLCGYRVGNAVLNVVVDDLNGDGKLDLTGSSYWDHQVWTMFGNGDGTFRNHSLYPANSYPQLMKTADYNYDGFPEIAVPNGGSGIGGGTGAFTVLQNLGDGYYTIPMKIATTGSDVRSLCTADFNRDGMMDVAIVNSNQGTIDVFLNNTAVTRTLKSLTIDPANATLGQQVPLGKVTLNVPAPRGGISVALSSDNTAVSVLSSVVVEEGQYSATFEIQGSTATQAAVTATALGANLSATVRFYAAPVIDSLNPESVLAGGPAFTLTVRGSGFMADSVVRWNDGDRTTTFVSSTELTASISTADIAAPGSAKVKVLNPVSNGWSNEKTVVFDYVYTLTASPDNGPANTNVTVRWTSPSGSSSEDWIGLYRQGAGDSQYLWFQYTSGQPTGSATVTLTTPGQYEFRLYRNRGYEKAATSNPVTIASEAGSFSVTANPTDVLIGRELNVSWTAGTGRPANDWVGLYKVGTPNTAFLWWTYTGGSEAGNAKTVAPLEPGQYEFRYLVRNGFEDVARSASITVRKPEGAYTLIGKPSTARVGENLTVEWTAPAGSSQKDWIGIYRVGDEARKYITWVYTNGQTSGTSTFKAPGPAGQYEFRYLLDDGYQEVITSNPITVNP